MAGDESLDSYYDAVVLGTGLAESILAAALARAGKTVLHLDHNEYYGQDFASFPLSALQDWARHQQQPQAQVPADALAAAAAAVLAEAHAKQQAELESKLTATDSSTAEQQSASGTADTSTMQSTDADNTAAAAAATAATDNAEKQQASKAVHDANADAA
eukprot:8748-Heterococcus_DN1.PRE.5